MPVYAYRCSQCDHEKDVLQKINDPELTECPQCLTSSFAKKLTAPGFMLKGNGWYATDFKNGGKSENPESKPSQKSEPPPCQGGTGSCPACT